MHAQIGPLSVRWTGGGLFLEVDGQGLLLDAPAGVTAALGPDLARVHGIVLTSDRARSVVGLVELLTALEPHRRRDLPLAVHVPLGAERGAMLAETWVRGWPDRYPLTLDAEMPGSRFSAGPFELWALSLAAGEPNWSDGEVHPILGTGLRVEVEGVVVSWVPVSGPHRHIQRLCAGADLAVVEVARVPWPRSDARWRLGPSEAIEAAAGAKSLWFPGDDGRIDAGPGSAS